MKSCSIFKIRKKKIEEREKSGEGGGVWEVVFPVSNTKTETLAFVLIL